MKNILLSTLLAFTACTTFAQKGFYIAGGLGYAVPAAGQTLDASGNPYSGSINNFPTQPLNNTYTVKKVSFSAGANAAIAVGYMFNGHVGVEVRGYAVVAPQQYIVTEVNVLSPAGTDLVKGTAKNYAQLPVFIMPALVYNTGGNKISGYARGGLALPMRGNVYQEQNTVHNPPDESTEYLKYQTKTKFSAGIAGAIGVIYAVSAKASIWVEANGMSLSLYAKSQTLETHIINNASTTIQPAQGTVVNYGTNGVYANNPPTYSIPFSNVGISAGIKISFAKEKSASAASHHTTPQ